MVIGEGTRYLTNEWLVNSNRKYAQPVIQFCVLVINVTIVLKQHEMM